LEFSIDEVLQKTRDELGKEINANTQEVEPVESREERKKREQLIKKYDYDEDV
jgi:hypothetical protein